MVPWQGELGEAQKRSENASDAASTSLAMANKRIFELEGQLDEHKQEAEAQTQAQEERLKKATAEKDEELRRLKADLEAEVRSSSCVRFVCVCVCVMHACDDEMSCDCDTHNNSFFLLTLKLVLAPFLQRFHRQESEMGLQSQVEEMQEGLKAAKKAQERAERKLAKLQKDLLGKISELVAQQPSSSETESLKRMTMEKQLMLKFMTHTNPALVADKENIQQAQQES